MTPEQVNAYFSPPLFIVYLFVILTVCFTVLQVQWTRVCKTKTQVLVIRAGGGGDYELVDKEGGSITLEHPTTHVVRTWPINELATIDVPYPGIGLLPDFLQKRIKQAIVDEEDWEPLLNRSPHHTKVASPDVIASIRDFANNLPNLFPDQDDLTAALKEELESIVEDVFTGPTRAMIASPAVLGNLKRETITQALATVTKEVFERLEEVFRRLEGLVTSKAVIIGFVIVAVAVGGLAYVEFSNKADITKQTQSNARIEQALGIVPPVTIAPAPKK